MSEYRIEAATKEEWASRALNAEARNKELTLQLLAAHGQAADALDKLAKAVKALRRYVSKEKGVLHTADVVLAELEGKNE
jgi:hypothetical protein